MQRKVAFNSGEEPTSHYVDGDSVLPLSRAILEECQAGSRNVLRLAKNKRLMHASGEY